MDIDKQKTTKYKRGDPHPTKEGLVFRRYQKEYLKEGYIIRESWTTKEKLEYYRQKSYINGKNHQAKPENKEKQKIRKKLYRSRPEKKLLERTAQLKYYSDPVNIENRNNTLKLYCRRKRQEDILFKLKEVLRNRLISYCKNKKIRKTEKTMILLGCSINFFRNYIENLFTEGMNWNNYGRGNDKWNIDHIIPLSSATTSEDLYKLNHYTNLQPLWFLDNIRKGGVKKNKTLC